MGGGEAVTAVLVFWLLTIGASWMAGYWQGKSHGVTEGRALEMLKRAGFERPMVRRKS